jgi:hypothetical protein
VSSSTKGKTRGQIAVEARQKEVEAVRLRGQGLSYHDIADRLDWADHTTAVKAVQRALDRSNEAEVATLRQLELARLAELEAEAWAVLRRDHLSVHFGRVATFEGQPVLDDGPKLAAIDRLTRLSAQRSRLLGLEAPIRKVVEVVTSDMIDQEIARLNRQIALLDGTPVDEQAMARYMETHSLS